LSVGSAPFGFGVDDPATRGGRLQRHLQAPFDLQAQRAKASGKLGWFDRHGLSFARCPRGQPATWS
jgi:hypothetical protein